MESLIYPCSHSPLRFHRTYSDTPSLAGGRSPHAGAISAGQRRATQELEQAWHQRLGTSPLTSEKLATLEALLAGGKSVADALEMAACFEASHLAFNRTTAIALFQKIDQATLQPFAKGKIGQATVYLCEYEDERGRRKAIFKPERKLNPLAGNFPQAARHAGVLDIKKGKIITPPRFAVRSVAASRVAEQMGVDLLPRSRLAIGHCHGVDLVGSVTDFCEGQSALGCRSSDDFFSMPAVSLNQAELLGNPAFLEKLLMLGIVDLIIGEPDRNPTNYHVQQNGMVRGIDTEQCFGKKLLTLADMVRAPNSTDESSQLMPCRPCDSGVFYFCDVPAVVTQSMKDSVERLRGKDLADILDALELNDAGEVSAAKSRLAEVKAKLRQSKVVSDGGLTLAEVRECGGTYLSRDWLEKHRPTMSSIGLDSATGSMNDSAFSGTLQATSFCSS